MHHERSHTWTSVLCCVKEFMIEQILSYLHPQTLCFYGNIRNLKEKERIHVLLYMTKKFNNISSLIQSSAEQNRFFRAIYSYKTNFFPYIMSSSI